MPEISRPRKAPKKASQPFVRLLIADEFRTESTGKLFAIGLYADGVVVFRVPRNAPPPTEEMPYGIDSLSLLITVGGFVGEEKVRISLDKKRQVEKTVNLQKGRSLNLNIPNRPFKLNAFGTQEVYAEVAGKKFTLQFEIRPEYVEAVDDLSSYMTVVTHNPAPPSAGLSVRERPAREPASASRQLKSKK